MNQSFFCPNSTKCPSTDPELPSYGDEPYCVYCETLTQSVPRYQKKTQPAPIFSMSMSSTGQHPYQLILRACCAKSGSDMVSHTAGSVPEAASAPPLSIAAPSTAAAPSTHNVEDENRPIAQVTSAACRRDQMHLDHAFRARCTRKLVYCV